MQFPHKLSLLFAVFFLFNSCIQPIEFEMPGNLQLLIVDGKITNSGKGDFLKLSMTSQGNYVPEPVYGAIVKIVDDVGREELLVSRHDLEPGTYQHTGEVVKGQPGLTYYVEISLLNGNIYRSLPETMPMLTAVDSFYLNYTFVKEQNATGDFVERKLVQLFTDTKLGQQNLPIFLKWDIDEMYRFAPTHFPDPFGSPPPPPCYISNIPNPQNIVIFNSTPGKPNEVKAIKLSTRVLDHAFLERFYFNIHLSSISKEAYDYWQKIDRVLNNVGTVFDAPPAPIRGNIYNVNNQSEQVLGYFQASSVQTTRLRVSGIDIPLFVPPYCEYFEHKTDYPIDCLNCLTIPNSTLVRPDYF